MYYIDSLEVENSCEHSHEHNSVHEKPFIPMESPALNEPISNDMVKELMQVFSSVVDTAKPVLSYIDTRRHHNERFCEKYEKSRNFRKMNLLNFVYRYDDIYEEVYKRTSFLAKNRASDTLAHQLSTMSFTRDEDFMFKPFIMEAASFIFECIYPFSKGVPEAFSFTPRTNTKTIEKAPDIVDVMDIDDGTNVTSSLIRHDDVIGSWYKLSGTTNVTKLSNIDNKKYEVKVVARFNYSVSSGTSMIRKSEYCHLHISARRNTPIKWETTIFVPEGVYGQDIEKFELVNSLEIVDSVVVPVGKPEFIHKGSYVEYSDGDNTRLFKARRNATTHDCIHNDVLFEKVIVDDRDAICFRLNILTWMDENAFKIADIAIFEAFINFVMYKWFMNVYPAEATVYYTQYMEYLDKIKYRLNAQKTPVRRKYTWI